MKTLTATLTLALLLSLAGAAPGAAARSRWEMTVTVQADDWDAVANPGGVPVLVLAPDEALLITDVVMTHNVSTTTDTFRANIRRGPASNPSDCSSASLFLGPYVSPDETVSLNLTTGVELKAEEQLCVVVGGAGGTDGITFSFIGQLSTP